MDEINPVAVVGPVYGIDWFGTGPVAPIIQEHGIKVGDYLYPQQAIDTLRAEVERLRSKTACTMGVGAGDGQLFVHGDYDSIKAVQALVFRAERAEAEAEALRKDAERYRWLCDGNGYFMEENYLCGHENDKERADLMIDIEIQAGQ